ncbi:hypothetical protein [Lebetimonas sp. JS032]|uniref:hypothetical protein n=1 Tax=Lebetimonas sp. JS032 TaxID=990070 RepID=UPI001F1D593D|nr:hypothetical protein [Lebetimonas sp. JS032]
MAITALISTASAINATLYATTQISYTLAKNGELPKEYEYNIFHSTEGLLISVALIIPIILFLNLTEITTVAALSVLIIQGIVHLGHLRVYHRTDANKYLVFLAFFFMFLVVILTLYYNALVFNRKFHMNDFGSFNFFDYPNFYYMAAKRPANWNYCNNRSIYSSYFRSCKF